LATTQLDQNHSSISGDLSPCNRGVAALSDGPGDEGQSG
jgi:hypothetical protein